MTPSPPLSLLPPIPGGGPHVDPELAGVRAGRNPEGHRHPGRVDTGTGKEGRRSQGIKKASGHVMHE